MKTLPLSVILLLTLAHSAAAISVRAGSLNFEYRTGGSPPPAQTISVTDGSPTAFTAEASGGSWISVSPTSSTSPATLAVSVNPAGLSPGSYTGTIAISARSANSTSTVRLSVSLEVIQPEGTQSSGVAIDSIANAASFLQGTSPKSWLSIFGRNFVSIPAPGRAWRAEEIVDGVLPVSLEGVTVLIDNKPAAMAFIGPNQINVQVPDSDSLGPVAVVVSGPNGTARSSIDLGALAPALFAGANSGGSRFAAAVHSDGAPVGSSTPARPGEIILLYGTGFGRTDPDRPAGRLVQAAPLASDCTVRIGGVAASLQYAGMVSPGLYQFNVEVPVLPGGNLPVEIETQGLKTQDGVLIAIGW